MRQKEGNMAELSSVNDKKKARTDRQWFEEPICPEDGLDSPDENHHEGLWERHHPLSLRGSREPLSVRQ